MILIKIDLLPSVLRFVMFGIGLVTSTFLREIFD